MVIYGQPGKIGVISSYSDVEKLSPLISEVHFRKFLNCNILFQVLEKCGELKKASVSKSAYSRCDSKCLEKLKESKIDVKISKVKGRPSILEINKELILW